MDLKSLYKEGRFVPESEHPSEADFMEEFEATTGNDARLLLEMLKGDLDHFGLSAKTVAETLADELSILLFGISKKKDVTPAKFTKYLFELNKLCMNINLLCDQIDIPESNSIRDIQQLSNKITRDIFLKAKPLESYAQNISLEKLRNKIEEMEISIEEIQASEQAKSLEEIRRYRDQCMDDLKAMSSNVSAVSDRVIEEMNNHAGNSAKKAIAGGYETRAVEEKKAADIWRLLTLFFMFASAYVLASTIFNIPFFETLSAAQNDGEGVDLPPTPYLDMGVKVLFSLLLTAPSVYCGRESTKHRTKQNAYEQIALNVKTANVITRELGKETQTEVIKEMAKRLFASPVGVDAKGGAADSMPLNSNELILKMVDKLDFKQPKEADKSAENGK